MKIHPKIDPVLMITEAISFGLWLWLETNYFFPGWRKKHIKCNGRHGVFWIS